MFLQKKKNGWALDYFSEPDTWTSLSTTWDGIEELMGLKQTCQQSGLKNSSQAFQDDSCWQKKNIVEEALKKRKEKEGEGGNGTGGFVTEMSSKVPRCHSFDCFRRRRR